MLVLRTSKFNGAVIKRCRFRDGISPGFIARRVLFLESFPSGRSTVASNGENLVMNYNS